MTISNKTLEAVTRMNVVAAKLVIVIGPTDTAGVLLASALGVLIEANGRDNALACLRQMVDDLEARGDETPTIGHG